MMDPQDGAAQVAMGRTLARRLEGVRDHAQRVVLIREFCDGQGSAAAASALQSLLEAVLRGDHKSAWLAIATAIADGDIPYDVMGDLYRAAVAARLGALRLMLIGTDRPHRLAREGEFPRDDVLESLSLGERKSKARTLDRETLERIMLDPDPAVVRIALRNPRTTERDVVRLAARRPNRPDVLREVMRVPRWMARANVQRALVQNPYSPVRLAVTLLPLLAPSELLDISRNKGLHPMLPAAARAILDLRGWREPTLH